MITIDLSMLAQEELEYASKLIKVFAKRTYPKSFINEGVTLGSDLYDGLIFLENKYKQRLVLTDTEELEIYYIAPSSFFHHQGTAKSLKEQYLAYPEKWVIQDVVFLLEMQIIETSEVSKIHISSLSEYQLDIINKRKESIKM